MEQDDELYSSMDEEQLADLFAEAAARVEAGEPIGAILESAPADYLAPLSAMLEIGAFALSQRSVPLPPRNEARRAANRAAFLQAAAEMHAENVAAQVASVDDNAKPAAQPKQLTQTRPSIFVVLANAWASFQQATTLQSYRFAPLIVTLTIAIVAALGMVSVTQAAVPGDLTYSVKNWARASGLVLTPPDERAKLAQRINDDIVADIVAAAQRNQESDSGVKDLNDLVIEATFTAPFQGYQGNQLLLGDMIVFPTYQPDANKQDRMEMEIEGDQLVEGALVEITVRILPGQSQYVQGVKARVITPSAPTAQPTLAPQDGSERPATGVSVTPAPRTRPPCTPTPRPGWILYTVKSGDSLSALAAQRQVAVITVSMANCLSSDLIVSGTSLYLPPAISTPLPPAATATPDATPPAPATPTATEGATVTAAPQTPGAETATPTPDDSATIAATATPTSPDGTPTVTEQPSQTATAVATENTAVPSATQEQTLTATATAPADASATPTEAATETPVPTSTAEPAPDATATTVDSEPAGPPTDTPPTATESPGETPPAQPATATETAPTPVAPPTVSEPTAAPPTAAPPTAAPPTAAPPTAAPPTAAPPTVSEPTAAPPTAAPPTVSEPTAAPPTAAPPTDNTGAASGAQTAPEPPAPAPPAEETEDGG